MATVYKIEIETVSPWVSYNEEDMKQMFEEFLSTYEFEGRDRPFESTTVNVEIIA